MIMPGYVDYFYRNGNLPAHTQASFREHKILTVHGIIVKNALLLMHRMKYFAGTLPHSIKQLFPSNLPTVESTHESCNDWLKSYNNQYYRASVFYKGPMLAITESNMEITSLPSLFSMNIYKSNAKRILLEQQSIKNDDESWPIFLLYDIPGLRRSTRKI